jgi:hypothetical protein
VIVTITGGHAPDGAAGANGTNGGTYRPGGPGEGGSGGADGGGILNAPVAGTWSMAALPDPSDTVAQERLAPAVERIPAGCTLRSPP